MGNAGLVICLNMVSSTNLNFHLFRAILHDEEIYPDPLTFNPERFMKSNTSLNPDPELYAFGFGRRLALHII
jgi:hypothetical protein